MGDGELGALQDFVQEASLLTAWLFGEGGMANGEWREMNGCKGIGRMDVLSKGKGRSRQEMPSVGLIGSGLLPPLLPAMMTTCASA